MSIDGKHRMMDVKIMHLRIYLSPRRKAITGVMRNGTIKESNAPILCEVRHLTLSEP